MAICRVADRWFGGRVIRVLMMLVAGAACMAANTDVAGAAVPVGRRLPPLKGPRLRALFQSNLVAQG
jgi:hypothetical protein